MKNKIFAIIVSLIIFAIVGTGLYMLLRPESQYKDINWETVEHTDAYDYHYYLELEVKEKIAYENVLNAYQTFPEQIEVPELDNAELEKVFTALLYDNPLLFCFGKNCKTLSSGDKFYFKPEYTMTKSEYDAKVLAIQNLTPEILKNLPSGGNEFEVELYLHDYIIDKCVYTDTDSFEETTLYGALIDGKASCEGYSRAMKYLSDFCNIDCYVLFGTAESNNGNGNHMWNIITIDGEKYHVDVTWNDTIAKDDTVPDHRYMYFNLTDEEIKNTHDNFKTNDKCTANKANYYVYNNLNFESFGAEDKRQLATAVAAAADSGNASLGVRFENKELYEKAINDLIEDQEIFDVLREADNKTDKTIETKKFYYRKVDNVKILEIMFSVV